MYAAIEAEKRNLVLIGMPGCGKTTLGKGAAKRLGKTFVDSDEEIRRQTGKAPAELITEMGEPAFRQIETQVIARLAAEQSSVIATGGGAVLNPENLRLLRENGTLVFIDRPVDKLAVTADRPLSATRELLAQRYRERYPLYRAAADEILPAVDSREDNVRRLAEIFRQAGDQGKEKTV